MALHAGEGLVRPYESCDCDLGISLLGKSKVHKNPHFHVFQVLSFTPNHELEPTEVRRYSPSE